MAEENLETFSTSTVMRQTGATLRQLYYWEKLGFIQPQYDKFGLRMYRRYGQKDLELISKIIGFLKEGYNLQTAGKKAININPLGVKEGDI